MTHDYKSDRERLEAELDKRQPVSDVDRLFACFGAVTLDEQLSRMISLQNELAAKAAGII